MKKIYFILLTSFLSLNALLAQEAIDIYYLSSGTEFKLDGILESFWSLV